MAAKILFKDGKIQFDGGKIQFVPNGGTAADCACCDGDCTASATACVNCDDVTPSQYQVTFSGVTECVGCLDVATTGIVITELKALNSTFTLSQTVNCEWEFVLTDAIRVDEYDDNTCTTLDLSTDRDVTITLKRNGTQWVLTMGIFGSEDVSLFSQTIAADTNAGNQLCATVPAFTANDNTLADCGNIYNALLGRFYAGYGGSATVVCL